MAEAVAERWNRDTLVGVIGAALLIGAMVGVFVYERGQFAAYDVSWSTSTGQTTTASANLQEGQDWAVSLEVQDPAAAEVLVTVAWTDTQGGQPDTVRVELTGPAGQRGTVESQESPLELTLPVGDPPALSAVTARSQGDARAQALSAVNATAGQGTWTATVTLVAAPGTPAPVGDVETEEDGENRVEVTLTHLRWDPQATPSS